MRIGNAYFKVYDLILSVLSLLVLAATTIWILSHWGSIPDAIPTHFDFTGNVDATGAKSNLWIMIGIAWFIWLTFTVLDFFPGAWNVRGLSDITSSAGKAKAISLTRTFLQIIKFLIACLFSYLALCQAQGRAASPLLLPLSIFLLMGTSVVHIVLLSRLK